MFIKTVNVVFKFIILIFADMREILIVVRESVRMVRNTRVSRRMRES